MNQIDQAIADYNAAYKWLLGLITDPTGKIEMTTRTPESRLQNFTERFANMRAFLDFAGNPEAQFKSVHIAGTSGKGSVTVMTAALLTACGLRTADHTSPFLQIPSEKLRVDGRMSAPSEFTRAVDTFRPIYERWVAQGGTLRYGQAWAIITWIWFAQANIDWGVYETSIGGRFSNANQMPSDISVVTNINYDHLKTLGPSLEQIGWHKAGVIRPNGVTVTAETKPAMLALLRNEAAEKNARLIEIEYAVSADGALSVTTPYCTYANLRPNLKGTFQFTNAATAITTVDWLAQKYGFELTDDAIVQGLNAVRYGGRFETIQEDPLVILDGAHNVHKMQALVGSMQQAYADRNITVMVGKLATKSDDTMLKLLVPLAKRFIVSQPKVYGKTPTPAAELATMMRRIAPDTPLEVHPKALDGVEAALSNMSADDILLITGSIYLIGGAREKWFPSRPMLRDLEKQYGVRQ